MAIGAKTIIRDVGFPSSTPESASATLGGMGRSGKSPENRYR